MRRKIFIIIPIVLSLAIAFVFMCFKGKPLPIDFSNVNKVEFYENSKLDETHNISEFEKFKLKIFDTNKDVASINQAFQKVRGEWNDCSACPFGLQIVFYEGNKRTFVELGTDGCGFVIYKKEYYRIPENDFNILQEFLEQNGIDLHKYI